MNTRTSERRVIDGVKKLLFIDGEWREAAGGDTRELDARILEHLIQALDFPCALFDS